MTINGWLQILFFLLAIFLVTPALGGDAPLEARALVAGLVDGENLAPHAQHLGAAVCPVHQKARRHLRPRCLRR